MKKLLLLFIPLVFFFSCEEENNNESTECLLYGTWEFYSEDYNGVDCFVYCTANIADAPCGPLNTSVDDICAQLTFNENGSFAYSQQNPYYYYQGTWDSSCSVNSTLELNSTEGGLEPYTINSISSNSLTIIDGDYRLVLKK